MHFTTLVFLIVCVPLILLALALFLYCLKGALSKDKRSDQARLLETAARIDANLSKMETRLSALEDILLQPAANGQQNQLNRQNLSGSAFDRKLADS
ncbi:MAG: hypothetical protein LBE80_09005 [Deltaproteobacteria bacterium]|jgi:hypothetical protein|nr:hypothetical protein [Deltaproteobacteria bacterium]